jgi:FixJ family two-component response regulator
MKRLPRLTPSEIKILPYLINLKSHQQISDALNISPRTLKFHLFNIYRKFRLPWGGGQMDLLRKMGRFDVQVVWVPKEDVLT